MQLLLLLGGTVSSNFPSLPSSRWSIVIHLIPRLQKAFLATCSTLVAESIPATSVGQCMFYTRLFPGYKNMNKMVTSTVRWFPKPNSGTSLFLKNSTDLKWCLKKPFSQLLPNRMWITDCFASSPPPQKKNKILC